MDQLQWELAVIQRLAHTGGGCGLGPLGKCNFPVQRVRGLSLHAGRKMNQAEVGH